MKPQIVLALLAFLPALCVAEPNSPAPAQSPATTQIQRGQYLVERVAMCADCHTPKNDKGEYDRTAWLQGDVLDFKPTQPTPFAAVAPPIAGLPSYAKDEDAVKFFETGINPGGKMALPPMPQLRLNHDDALAVVAYLRSLKR